MNGKPGISPRRRGAELHCDQAAGSAASSQGTPHRIPIEPDTGAPPAADDDRLGTVARIRNLKDLRTNVVAWLFIASTLGL